MHHPSKQDNHDPNPVNHVHVIRHVSILMLNHTVDNLIGCTDNILASARCQAAADVARLTSSAEQLAQAALEYAQAHVDNTEHPSSNGAACSQLDHQVLLERSAKAQAVSHCQQLNGCGFCTSECTAHQT